MIEKEAKAAGNAAADEEDASRALLASESLGVKVKTSSAKEKSGHPPTAHDNDEDTDGVPYDRGWAWMVLFGSLVNYILISAYTKTSGVFFVELLHHFQEPASKTALLFAIRGGVLSVTGMFIMNAVIGRLGCRKTALIGAVLMALSAILSSLANDLILLICLQAVLLGIADAMLGSSGEVLTATYFRKRRSLAMGIVKAGASIGSLSYPPLLTYLVLEYGLRGALLLTGAASLHSIPAALLYRPTSYFRQKRAKLPLTVDPNGEKCMEHLTQNSPRKDQESLEPSTRNSPLRDVPVGISVTDNPRNYEEMEPETKLTNNENVTVDPRHRRICEKAALKRALTSELEAKFKPLAVSAAERKVQSSVVAVSRLEQVLTSDSRSGYKNQEVVLSEKSQGKPLLEASVDNMERNTISDFKYKNQEAVRSQNPKSVPPLDGSVDNRSTSSANTNSGTHPTRGETQNTEQAKPLLQRCLKSITSILDFSLFRRLSFILLFFYYMFSPTVNVGVDYLPALAEQHGVSKSQAAVLLSIIGGLDLFSRLATGFVANLEVVPIPVMACVALTALGAVYQCTGLLTSFGLLVVLAVAQGVLAGVVNCLVSMIILHVVGLTQLAKGIGFQLLAEGAFLAAFHPLLGYIRDTTGSYVAVYHVVGGCLITAALLLFCEELVRKREERKQGVN